MEEGEKDERKYSILAFIYISIFEGFLTFICVDKHYTSKSVSLIIN